MTLWKQHVSKWTECVACPLHRQRTQVVLARGTIPCEVLFVGEAPGASEDSLGVPFIGPAGKLLDRMIREAEDLAQHKPKSIAMTNIVACIPKQNGRVIQPTKEEINNCRPRLLEFLEIARPQRIIVLGDLAAKSIRTLKIKTPTEFLSHPARVLRSPTGQRELLDQQLVIGIAGVYSSLQQL